MIFQSTSSRAARPPAPSYPPEPADAGERARVQHTRLRRRILYGQHERDVEERLVEAAGPNRAAIWGTIDLVSNPMAQVYSRLSVLYAGAPTLTVPTGGEDVAAALDECGFWQLAPRLQRDTLALREMFVRVAVGADRSVACLPVFPDLVPSVRADLLGRLTRVEEWVPDPDDSSQWVRLVHDVGGPEPILCAWTVEGKDCSPRVLGGSFSGSAYPHRDAGGAPLLPYVAYHAAQTGSPFDPYTSSDVVEGTLTLSVLYSFWDHVVRAASWRQRYAVGVEPAGLSPMAGVHAQAAGADPSSISIFTPTEDGGGTASVGTFEQPSDAEELLRSIHARESRLVSAALGSADVSRSDSEIRSQYSLAVSREAQREAQRAYEPLFRRSDLQLIRLVASLLGAPTAGWAIQYSSIPRDPGEAAAELERVEKQISLKLLDRTGAWLALHPGASEADAITAIAQIDAAAPTKEGYLVGFVDKAVELAKSVYSGEVGADQARAVLEKMVGAPAEDAAAIAPDSAEGRRPVISSPSPAVEATTNE